MGKCMKIIKMFKREGNLLQYIYYFIYRKQVSSTLKVSYYNIQS